MTLKKKNDSEPRNEIDPRNDLNDLTSKEWVKRTKSIWYSQPPQRDKLKIQHPATFAESDIEELLLFFTKRGNKVLDPFLGVGSTLIACYNKDRHGIGIELINKWVEIARKRVKLVTSQLKLDQINKEERITQTIIHGDAREKMKDFNDNEFDFIVTSPPYWKILRKAVDHKSKQERINKGLPTKYSEHEADLGNITEYSEFLNELKRIFAQCYRVLKKKKYMCVIITDFRIRQRFIMYHADLAQRICELGFILKAANILVQDSKTLYPYGYPFDYVPNVHHQFILIFRKPE
ncbi:DNA methyltransferase [Candidatus Borrarchaeum sp.]|uniref:DNA methyltransferase n=1 Tax=Candidatus Borrarchaeum sp. TaxID=2846742 RepID=UPI00257A1F51|nr:DNA methyltransferase [Candidatus Borrarchaeum sp.]